MICLRCFKVWVLCIKSNLKSLSNYTELSPFWEANNLSSTENVPNILWKWKFPCHVHKSLTPVPVLNQMSAVHATPSCLSHVWNLMSSWLRLHHPKESAQICGSHVTFHNKLFFFIMARNATPQPEDHSLSAILSFLLSMFAATLDIWKTWPEDVPCHGDKGPNLCGSF